MATWVWILIAIVAVAVIVVLALGARKRKTAALRERFGPEYDRTVEERENRRAAEAELRMREKQRAQFTIKPLPEPTRLRFANEWRAVQERFVDEPVQAVGAADTLITRVMEARGYPTAKFEAQADAVSVDHPDVVENYRFGHAVAQRAQRQQTSTEELREALLRYRSLFDELLRPDGSETASTSTGQAGSGAQAPDLAQNDRDTRVARPADTAAAGPADTRVAGSADTKVAGPAEDAAAPAPDAAAPKTGEPAYPDPAAPGARP